MYNGTGFFLECCANIVADKPANGHRSVLATDSNAACVYSTTSSGRGSRLGQAFAGRFFRYSARTALGSVPCGRCCRSLQPGIGGPFFKLVELQQTQLKEPSYAADLFTPWPPPYGKSIKNNSLLLNTYIVNRQ